MQLQKILLFSFVLLSFTALKAQDIHFSYFELSPITFNPAQTGAFSGTIRLTGHFRGQWLNNGDFNTLAFSVDSPVIRGFRDNDWIGGGINLYTDTAGSGGLKTNGGGLNAAYHFGFDKNYSRVFSIGVKYGTISRSVNDDAAFIFRNGDRTELINSFQATPDISDLFTVRDGGGFDGGSATDIGIGILYKASVDKTTEFALGLSADHLTSPRISFAQSNDGIGDGMMMLPTLTQCQMDPSILGCDEVLNQDPNTGARFQTTENRGVRISATGNLTRYINDKVRLSPAALVQFTEQGFEAQVHAIAGYLIDPKKGTVINGGFGIRAIGLADAQLYFGVEMKELTVGAAFDLGLLGFQSAGGFQSAFELAATYVINIYKDPDVDPVIFCPRF